MIGLRGIPHQTSSDPVASERVGDLMYRRPTYEIAPAFLIYAVLLRLALDFVYHDVVSVVFSYQGFLGGFHLSPYLESWLAFIILLIVVPKRLKRPSDFFVAYLVLVTALPFIVLYPAMQAPSWTLWFFVATVFAICVFRFPKPFKILLIRGGRKNYLIGALFIVSVVTLYLIAMGGLNHFNLNFARVYEIRNDIDTLGVSSLMNFLTVWTTKVFGPIIMAIFLLQRRYTLALMVVLLHVVWFGISQHKSVLFYPLLVFLTFRFIIKGGSLLFLPISLLAITVVSYLFYHFVDDVITTSYLVRRPLFTPALLTFDYYAFFEQNDFVYWSNSIFRFFVPYPYDESVTLMISGIRGGGGGANNHFLATGYMQAGAFGLLVYAAIIIVILNIFDSFQNKGLPTWFMVAVGIVPIQALFASADLPVAVMTHGLGICIISLIFVCSRHLKYKEEI